MELNSMNKYLVIIYLFILSTNVFSQNNTDMVNEISLAIHTKPKFFLMFDNKNSFISTRKAWVIGGKFGFEYNQVFRVGMGFYTMYNETYSHYFNQIKESSDKLNFNYLTVFSEYIFLNHKNYEFSLPIHFAYGMSWINNYKSLTKGSMLFYETMLNSMYYPFRFVGVGIGLGYRIVFYNNPNIKENFMGPLYSIKLKLFLNKRY